MPDCPNPDGSSPQQRKFDGPPPMCIDPDKAYTAEMVTSHGSITISLDPVQAPKTVNNFVFLARYHYFDGLNFHRVVPGFVLQGGCPEGSGRGGPGYRFEDELPKPGRYELGSLAMANAGPNTNGSQFFIVTADACPWLDGKHTVFGRVTSGMDVVDRIANVDTGPGDRPRDEVRIEGITLE
jgi:cyclophilin family peptidyl-prolyl cis-trans isomerase